MKRREAGKETEGGGTGQTPGTTGTTEGLGQRTARQTGWTMQPQEDTSQDDPGLRGGLQR